MRTILSICLLLLATAAVCSETAGRKWAIVIGINRYQSPGITPLRFAEADARKLAEALVSHAGFQPKDVFVLTSDRTGYELPTRANIAFRFDYLIKSIGPNDTLLVYFSGHGLEVEGQSFLLTAEADSRSLLTLQQSALNASDLFRWLGATRAARTLLVVDACRNDPMAGKGDSHSQLSDRMASALTPVPRSADPKARATFFACSAGQRSFEWSEQGHGFFTYYLVEGLRGQAAGADGRVTLQSLTHYVQREVADASSRWLLQQQVPWLRYEGPGADGWELAGGQAASQPAGTDLSGGMRGSKPLLVSHEQQAPYKNLAAALQDAPANSVIMVTAGTYREDLLFTRPVTIDGDKSVLEGTLRAEAPVKLVNCTIRGRLVPLSSFQLIRCSLEPRR